MVTNEVYIRPRMTAQFTRLKTVGQSFAFPVRVINSNIPNRIYFFPRIRQHSVTGLPSISLPMSFAPLNQAKLSQPNFAYKIQPTSLDFRSI